MTQQELDKVLALHKKWLENKEGGVRANFSSADLRNTDFRNTDLRCLDLRGLDLWGTDFRGADLRGLDIRGTGFRGVYLSDARGIHSWRGGEHNRLVYSIKHLNCVMHKAVCFWGNTEEFVAAIRKKYGKDSNYERLALIYDDMLTNEKH